MAKGQLGGTLPQKKAQIRWDDEKVGFLREHYPNVALSELTKSFNARFGTQVSVGAIGQQLHAKRILKRTRAETKPA